MSNSRNRESRAATCTQHSCVPRATGRAADYTNTPSCAAHAESTAEMPARDKQDRGCLYKLEVTNFKSYAGTLEIGPFKDFTCVIGPNGSGSLACQFRFPMHRTCAPSATVLASEWAALLVAAFACNLSGKNTRGPCFPLARRKVRDLWM